MQEIHHFLQGFLRLVFSGYILKRDSRLLLHIHLRIALSNAHHSAALAHLPHQIRKEGNHQTDGKDQCHKQFKKELSHRILHFTLEHHSCIVQRLNELIVIDISRIVVRTAISASLSARLVPDLIYNI